MLIRKLLGNFEIVVTTIIAMLYYRKGQAGTPARNVSDTEKCGTFAIHDLMSRARYGDMDALISKLKAMDMKMYS